MLKAFLLQQHLNLDTFDQILKTSKYILKTSQALAYINTSITQINKHQEAEPDWQRDRNPR